MWIRLTAFVSNCATVDDLENKSSTEDDEEEEDEEEKDEGGGMIDLAAHVNVNSMRSSIKALEGISTSSVAVCSYTALVTDLINIA